MSTENGLRQRIFAASNETEIKDLLTVGAKFQFASEATKRRWKIAARRRTAVLAGKSYVTEAPVEAVEDVPAKKRSKKKSR